MLLARKQDIEEIIAENLAKNPYSTGPQLVAMVNRTRDNTTKQAVYTALKNLMESEVVAKVGHTYFLSRVWLAKVEQLFSTQKEKEVVRDAVFDLKEGQSISYKFPTLLTCDTYWAHVFSILSEWIDPKVPIIIYMPHEWFVIGRTEVEKDVFKGFEQHKKLALFTIGDVTPLDQLFKREWKSEFVQTHLDEKNGFPRSYHVHIFGDFLIEVFIADDLAREIDCFYEENQTLTEENSKSFQALINRKSSVRMKISRKPQKAIRLRKQLAKSFHIPRTSEPVT
jgi:hypothetical protein